MEDYFITKIIIDNQHANHIKNILKSFQIKDLQFMIESCDKTMNNITYKLVFAINSYARSDVLTRAIKDKLIDYKSVQTNKIKKPLDEIINEIKLSCENTVIYNKNSKIKDIMFFKKRTFPTLEEFPLIFINYIDDNLIEIDKTIPFEEFFDRIIKKMQKEGIIFYHIYHFKDNVIFGIKNYLEEFA